MNETIGDIQALTEYFTHEDEQSREEGKHLYPRECLHRLGEFREDKKTHRSIDQTYDIICDIEKGVHYRVLVRKYGRDFLIHYKTYLDFVHEMSVQEFYHFGHRYKEMRETNGDLDLTHLHAVQISTERPLQKEDLL